MDHQIIVPFGVTPVIPEIVDGGTKVRPITPVIGGCLGSKTKMPSEDVIVGQPEPVQPGG